MSSAEIVAELFLSKNTVDTHRSNMIRKIGVKRNVELISMAIKNGLLLVSFQLICASNKSLIMQLQNMMIKGQ